ncbi:hypothetical protein O9X98_06900 [Agrobacterium salinitolerans]|nr:hypothetical protein [Agrobacterium salinitolerans]
MKIELKYPVTARAKVAGDVKVQAFGILTGKFELPEATDASHPIAVDFHSGKTETPQRFRFDLETGQVYRYVGTVNNAVKAGSLTGGYDGELAFNELFSTQRSQYEFLVKAGKPVTPELRPPLAFVADRHPFGEGVAETNQSDVRKCFDQTQDHLSTYVVVNGAIWQPCAEPTLKVSRGNDAWGMHLGLHEFYSRDWHTYYFAIDEFDLAYEWIGTLDDEVKQRPRLEPKIVIDPRYQTVTRGAVEDVRQLARHVMQKVGCATDNLAEQRPDVIMAYSDLKRFLETPSEQIDDADVDAAVATVDRLCTADENQQIAYEASHPLRPRNTPLRQFRTAVDLHIRRWQDRPINIVTNRPSPRLG